MRVRFSSRAEEDILNAVRHIAADNPNAARIVSRRIREAAERLRDLPKIGRVGRVESTRERPVSRTPYLLIYRLDEDEVVVLRILHGRQNWPSI
jgi:toxin ParE1/3/4